ncbi:hypothetical protein ACFLZ5_04830 [Thermodesulfobacteriota bacterium]
MMKRVTLLSIILAVFLCFNLAMALDTVPPVIELPGTQPQEVSNLESPDKCDNCHGGYNTAVEPAFNWRGSMMANAGRDPIFWATVAVAEQDFGGAGDLCIRCHSTGGWLAGRSTPTDGSGLASGDGDGVECDYCHKLTNPDDSEFQGVMNDPFIANDPVTGEGYYGSGMSSIWGGNEKLGPFGDAQARHKWDKSKFHRSVDFCGTCHDVSNSAVGTLAHNFGAQATAESSVDPSSNVAFNNPPYKYGVVERTFSEYKSGLISQTLVDNYPDLPADLQGGALKAIYDDATEKGTKSANYEDGDERFYSCQTCHMRPVFGQGCNKNPPFRSDLPLHDMTGGNYWMPEAIQYLDAQGKLRLGGGLNATQNAALDAAKLRAKEQLNLAASLSVQGNTLKIVNHTGHKLISGYPEGRRMWLNIKWFDINGDEMIANEVGAYGPIGVIVPNPADGLPVEVESIINLDDPNLQIYEAHYGMDKAWAETLVDILGYDPGLVLSYDRSQITLNPDTEYTLGDLASSVPGTTHETFHFVLNNQVLKDNRIPPYGMDYEEARKRNALPVPDSQYGGGPGKTYDYFDTFALNPPSGAQSATINLMYQPTSWEYIQFLWLANNKSNSFLANEGEYMLDAWLNNNMAAPYIMASTTWGDAPQPCDATTPNLLSATPDDKSVTVTWESLAGETYRLYYDQGGKAQLVADALSANSYTDTGLTNQQEYCYKVTSYTETCESSFSNILCAIPSNQGQARIGVDTVITGFYERIGKGKNATVAFVPGSAFIAGDIVIIRATVLDTATGLPVQNATVNISITGAETATPTTNNPSDANGIVEATWETSRPNRKGNGGTTPGSYTATIADLTAAGYTWDGLQRSVSFTVE